MYIYGFSELGFDIKANYVPPQAVHTFSYLYHGPHENNNQIIELPPTLLGMNMEAEAELGGFMSLNCYRWYAY